MFRQNRKLLNKLDKYLGGDILRYELTGSKEKTKVDGGNEFFDYLVSVATRSIGLRASIKPFNESQDYLLSYILDMFNLTTDSQLANLSTMGTLKRHSWRPELRIRLQVKSMTRNKQNLFNNLMVRVYLFRENNNQTGSTSGIFEKYKLESWNLIRPVNEMRAMVRFQVNESDDALLGFRNSNNDHKMVQVNSKNRIISEEDLKLNLRRHYCEPKTGHILRFEFWSKSSGSNQLKWLRNLIKRLIYDGCRVAEGNTNYMNQDQDFYGYTNIKLTQLASYPTKQSYPILSIRDKKLNNCEICLEVRNRRILDDFQTVDQVATTNRPDVTKKSKEKFLIYHMRLYANCLLYQYKSLANSNQKLGVDLLRAVTIDNLFYIPAYTLINQHRLQSNLNQLEDKHLKRVSILRLLFKLTEFEGYKTRQIQCMLVSILQNEYIIANGTIDDKTMHEIDPFGDSISESIIDLELLCLSELIEKFLTTQIERYFINKNLKPNSKDDINRVIALSSLKMFKLALGHFKDRIGDLERIVDTTLCNVIISHISQAISSSLFGVDSTQQTPDSINIPTNQKESNEKSWLNLLKQLKFIDHDIKLYWNRKGLRNLLGKQTQEGKQETVKMFTELERRGLKSMIQVKLNKYYLQ